jgi:hypothetical protein
MTERKQECWMIWDEGHKRFWSERISTQEECERYVTYWVSRYPSQHDLTPVKVEIREIPEQPEEERFKKQDRDDAQRLQIAAMVLQGLLANSGEILPGMKPFPVVAVQFADLLIAEVVK